MLQTSLSSCSGNYNKFTQVNQWNRYQSFCSNLGFVFLTAIAKSTLELRESLPTKHESMVDIQRVLGSVCSFLACFTQICQFTVSGQEEGGVGGGGSGSG